MDEVNNLFALAVLHGLTSENLKTTMFAYSPGASDIGSIWQGCMLKQVTW